MDQIKVGKFIAKCRHEKKLTQAELADKLMVTDRAISKWETGNGMPDSSIMLDLCNELGISVNELLSGEKINMKDYFEKAEENLICMKQSEDNINKKLDIVKKIAFVICIIFSVIEVGIFIAHLVMNYLYPESYNGWLFEVTFPMCICLCFMFLFTSSIYSFVDKYEIVKRR